MKPIRLVSLAALAAVLSLGLLIIPQPNAALSTLAQATASPTFVPTINLSDDPAFATPVPIPTLSVTITPSGPRIMPYVIIPPPAGSDRLVTIYDVLPERFGRFSLPRIYGSEIREKFIYDIVLLPDEPLFVEYERQTVRVQYAVSIRYTRDDAIVGRVRDIARMQFRNVIVDFMVGPSPVPTNLAGVGLSIEDVKAIFRDVKLFLQRCPIPANCLPAGE